MLLISVLSVIALIIAGVLSFFIVRLRRVVATNEVHIVQTRKSTTSYGRLTNSDAELNIASDKPQSKEASNGNTYYEWPRWIPFLGITKTVLPISVFSIELVSYEAFDSKRLPFVVDIVAFFRISDSNVAAQRSADYAELSHQLHSIVKGAVRAILASHEIDSIMQDRSKFGSEFTQTIAKELTNWGVVAVKNIELMDIRDAEYSEVIKNIMAKQKSFIDMQSRVAVADNKRTAENAEIAANREIDIQKQVAAEQVGIQTANKDREVGLANEKMKQAIQDQTVITQQKIINTKLVEDVGQATVSRDVAIVEAERQQRTSIIEAEGIKARDVLIAEGKLAAKQRESEGIIVEGSAVADAATKMQMAPVTAQVTLAKEIGTNEGYQKYLLSVAKIAAEQVVGVEQAKALAHAEIKIIANSGDVNTGMGGLGSLISAQGGSKLGAMVEGFMNTTGLVSDAKEKRGSKNGTG